MSWRRHLFECGKQYTVIQDAVSLHWEFRKGEIVTFVRSGYSHYDSSSCFEFISVPDATAKSWLLHDDEAETLAWSVFEPGLD